MARGMSLVETRLESAVAILTLNRPGKRNAMRRGIQEDLVRSLRAVKGALRRSYAQLLSESGLTITPHVGIGAAPRNGT